MDLNDAFGFATILASLEVVRTTLAVPLWAIDGPKVVFLVYFFSFRMKMYLDDSKHQFSGRNLIDVGLALLSWIAFLISVAAVPKFLNVAYAWFAIGLVISILWLLWSASLDPTWWKRHVAFMFWNVVHIALLWGAANFTPYVLIVSIACVAVDAVLTSEYFSKHPEA